MRFALLDTYVDSSEVADLRQRRPPDPAPTRFPDSPGWGGASVRVIGTTLVAPTVSVIVGYTSAGGSAMTRSSTVAPSVLMSRAQRRGQDVDVHFARLGVPILPSAPGLSR